MKTKIIITFLVLTLVSLFFPGKTYGQQKLAGSSAAFFDTEFKAKEDKRAKILKGYLETYNSPLAPMSNTFINEADKYNLDWKLVAAISGVESTFAHELPYNSYNAWGWGIYGDNIHYFQSYEDAIRTISKGLREDYMNKWGAEDIYQIGRFYAASPSWAQRVDFFMAKIDSYGLGNPKDSLSLTL